MIQSVARQDGDATPKAPAIVVRDLRVDYGDFTALHDASFQVEAGQIFGLLGPNGAGKTSAFRVIATLLEPTYGDVSLCGIDIAEHPEQARAILGYMPDLAPVPQDLKAWEFIECFAGAYGVPANERKARVEEALEMVGLQDKRSSYCGELSRGMTQRLVLAKTLLPNPKVLILDEPASGMDPIARSDLQVALARLSRQGVAILISSHILGELANMCTHLGILHKGRMITEGSVEAVTEQFSGKRKRLAVRVLGGPESLTRFLTGREGAGPISQEKDEFSFPFEGDDAAEALLLREMVTAGIPVRSFRSQRLQLEEILKEVAKEKNP